MMEKYDIVIIGAGISGLSLAHYCVKEGLKTLVLEKGGKIGGTFKTHRFEGNAGGFWMELGAHTAYNSYGNLLGIMEECNMLDRLLKRERVGYTMWVDNRIQSIPSQLSFIKLLFSIPRILSAKKAGQSIRSYYSPVVGKRNFQKVFSALFSAVISQDADEFPADLLFKKRPRRKDVMKSFTVVDGLQSIPEKVASQESMEIRRGKAVQRIHYEGNVYRALTPDGDSYESPSLAIATPATTAGELLKTSFPELSDQLSQIKVVEVESVGIAVKKDLIALKPIAGIIPINDIFHSVVSRDTVPHENYRGFTFHFKPAAINHDSKLKRIGEVLGVRLVELEHVATKQNLVPVLRVGHENLVNQIDNLTKEKRLFLTGNYFDGVAIEDCVSRSLKEFLRLKTLIS